MQQPATFETGQTVLVTSQSRNPSELGYAEALAMVGHICVINADNVDLGVSVLDPAMKTAWVFGRAELTPCPRLSNDELRAIKLMAMGNRAEPVPGPRIAIGGNPVCDVQAICNLATLGLVAQVPGTNSWATTSTGARLAVKAAA